MAVSMKSKICHYYASLHMIGSIRPITIHKYYRAFPIIKSYSLVRNYQQAKAPNGYMVNSKASKLINQVGS